MFDEAIGELIENKDTKHIKESITDPESGCFHKGEKEKCFAYIHQVFCDKNGYKQYKSNPDKCANCPLKDQCTKSKKYYVIYGKNTKNRQMKIDILKIGRTIIQKEKKLLKEFLGIVKNNTI